MKSFKALFVLFIAAAVFAAGFATPADADPGTEETADIETVEVKRSLKRGADELTFTLDTYVLDDRHYTKTITVKDAGGKTIQEIATADFNDGEDAWTYWTYDVDPDGRLIFADLNFDGWQDMEIVPFVAAGPGIPCIVWLWDAGGKQFVHDKTLSELVNVESDGEAKVIKSHYRVNASQYGEDYYKYIDGKLTLVKSVAWIYLDGDDKGMVEEAISELKDGKMTETSRVKKKRESEE
jgi:hypothetical protein